MKKEEFVQAFKQQYGGYICVDNSIVEKFYDKFYQYYHNVRCYTDECILDFCKDYILSQDFAEEVVL